MHGSSAHLGESGATYKVAVTTGDRRNGSTDAKVRTDFDAPDYLIYLSRFCKQLIITEGILKVINIKSIAFTKCA